MRRYLPIAGIAAAAALLAGLALADCNGPKPSPPAPVTSCVGDHDRDCPAGEPDNDGNPPRKTVAGVVDRETIRATAAGGSCGVELWPIKVMVDPNAGSVNLTPKPTTVDAINALPAPADPTTRLGDAFELQAWQVTATLTGYKLEADSDYHLVLKSPAGKTMIAEIPAPSCAEPPAEPSTSRVLAAIKSARAAFDAAHPASGACFNCLSQTVTLTGVGFYDRPHGQNGVADNAAELHPVLSFAVGGSPVPTPPVTTPTTTSTPTTTTDTGPGCGRYPGRHYYHHRFHHECRSYYFTTP